MGEIEYITTETQTLEPIKKSKRIEVIGYLGVIFTLTASAYVAVFQDIPLFVWLCWTAGSIFSIIRTITLKDKPNSIIFIIFLICNSIGILRYFFV